MNKIIKSQSQLSFATGLFPITFAPLLNLFCLLFMMLVISPFYVFPAGIAVGLPKTITSDIVSENTTLITITGEDIIYFENKIISDKELKTRLQSPALKKQAILIKADGRSSLARIIDVWNVCRELGLEKINIATTVNK